MNLNRRKVRWWSRLIAALLSTVGKTGTAGLPSGERQRYGGARVKVESEADLDRRGGVPLRRKRQ